MVRKYEISEGFGSAATFAIPQQQQRRHQKLAGKNCNWIGFAELTTWFRATYKHTHTHLHTQINIHWTYTRTTHTHTHANKVVTVSMKATRLNEVLFATIVLGLNGYFIGSANANEGMYVFAFISRTQTTRTLALQCTSSQFLQFIKFHT